MFTGIIEALGEVTAMTEEQANRRFTVRAPFTAELSLGASVAHNGVCLTIERTHSGQGTYEVVAVAETLQRSNLGRSTPGSLLNLERSLQYGGRLEGHFVQGHVDATGSLLQVQEQAGSWLLRFSVPPEAVPLLVPKGSITVNGISLTVVSAPSLTDLSFTVAIIPHTWQHTNLNLLKLGDRVNLEYDILGKYALKALGYHRGTGGQVPPGASPLDPAAPATAGGSLIRGI